MRVLLVLFLAMLAAPFAHAQEPPWGDLLPELSPFQGVELQEDGYHVLLDETWYLLVSLNDVAATKYRDFCEATYGRRAEKRFAEDLVAVMVAMGQKVVVEVDLEVKDLASGEITQRTETMTAENRRAVWELRNAAEERSAAASARPALRRVERPHATEVDPRYADLAVGVSWVGWEGRPTISRQEAEQDLDQLEWDVRNEHSYAALCGVDVAAAFDALRLGLGDVQPLGDFAERVARLIALFGDGHARVRGLDRYLPSGYLPFLLADAEGGCVAFRPDRRDFVDPERPFVRSIDGQPVEVWVAAVDDLVPVGSPANTRYRGLRQLRQFAYARMRRGVEASPTVTVELVDATGEDARTHVLDLAHVKPTYGAWPRTTTRRMDDVGYLRIDSMDDAPDFVAELERSIAAFTDAERLLIDVRGNGGGTRDALRTVLPHILVREGGPHVYNVGAYRLPDGEAEDETEGHLANRFLFPAASSIWSEREAHAIALAAMPFVADWTLPEGDFTGWHYGLVSPTDASPEAPRDVIVLMDTGCFSATDIFLGAFEGLPGVTLMGTPSGGGSGRSRGKTLAHSGLELRLSSMASFRPDGRRYDGLGIEPDVVWRPRAADFLVDRGDSMLRAAMDR